MNLYIHIPFCSARCTYCDFNTYAGIMHHLSDYLRALRAEIRMVGQAWCRSHDDMLNVDTLFIGGGTPSLVPLEEYHLLKEALDESFLLNDNMEWSLEANPGTLTPDYLQGLHMLGVNRLSLGVQSTHADELKLLGRIHTYTEAQAAFDNARAYGFDNINLDLIYGLPRQSLGSWKESLQRVLKLQPDHLSLYALSVENGTPLHASVVCGELPLPDDDLSADMYTYAETLLDEAGYAHYEISNWARLLNHERADTLTPERICRHNVHIWRGQSYLGFGAGAHGYASGLRYSNRLHPLDYIAAIDSDTAPHDFPCSTAVLESMPIDPDLIRAESIILGLRLLREGVDRSVYCERYGEPLEKRYAGILEDYHDTGLLELRKDRIRLTPRGHFLANQVMQAFLP